jgi:hypothetical protein
VKINEDVYTYMFGPKVAYRKLEKIVPFGHVLFGGALRKSGQL